MLHSPNLALAACLIFRSAIAFGDSLPNPFPPQPLPVGDPIVWRFPESIPDWKVQRDCEVQAGPTDHTLLHLTGSDPIIERTVPANDQQLMIELVCRTKSAATGQFFWDPSDARRFTEKQSRRFELQADNQWHTYRVVVPDRGIRSIRWDPTDFPGTLEVQEIRLQPYEMPPIEVAQLTWSNSQQLKVQLANRTGNEVTAKVFLQVGESTKLVGLTEIAMAASAAEEFDWTVPKSSFAADAVTVVVESPQTSTTFSQGKAHPANRVERRTVRVSAIDDLRGDQPWDKLLSGWLRLVQDDRSVWFSPDGTAAFIGVRSAESKPWRLAAWIAPIVWDRSQIVPLHLVRNGPMIEATSGLATARFQWLEENLAIELESEQIVEGPVLHVPGEIEQALLSGIEYLGHGESSSSSIDIETLDRFRYEPLPYHLTAQLASIITAENSLSLRWSDPALQPVFATPNFFDGTRDSRIGLRGRKIQATLRITRGWNQGGRMEDVILNDLQSRPLPPLPPPARPDSEQVELDRAGFTRSQLLVANSGWYHAILPGANGMPASPQWFGDHASALLALHTPLPVEASKLVRGGSHLENSRWAFLLGRADQWAKFQTRDLPRLLERQRPDGSFTYDGPWADGHFERTSSGQCGLHAQRLMQIAWQTGNQQALAAGLKTLRYCQRFRTPRGAQVWECPLHAPDIMASAHLTNAHVLAFRMTGDASHLQQAVRWAASGLPFVFQWGMSPSMRYATIATLCATHRVAPLWIGRPVQWCGLVYADSILDLAEVDQTLDWKYIATGIYRSATHQQYAEGPSIGLLPDSFLPQSNRRFPYDINPSTIVQVGQRIQGLPVQLECQVVDGHHIVSPWSMQADAAKLKFNNESNDPFQIAVDGEIRMIQPGQTLSRPIQ